MEVGDSLVPLATAILDTSVLYPAVLRDTLLRAAEAGLYRPRWSADILAELRRNLIGDAGITDDRATRLIDLMEAAFPRAAVVDYRPLTPQMLNHPKDRHVLAAAVAGGAGTIVTANLRDFPVAAVAPHDIVARSADSFLVELDRRAPDRLRQVLHEQAADLRRPPLTYDELLSALAQHAPRFAALLVL